METIRVNMTPCEDIKTIHASQNDNEGREWGFELHNNGEKIDSSSISDQMVFKAYKGGTEQLLPENTSTPTTTPILADIQYPDGLRTDQYFTYRETPTTVSNKARIKTIKGNTIVWNQLIQNGNFVSKTAWIESDATYSVSNNVATITASAQYGCIQQQTTYKAHKYLVCCDLKLTTASSYRQISLRPLPSIVITGTETTEWQHLAQIFTATEGVAYYPRIIDTRTTGFDAVYVKNVMLFDLTQMGLDITDPSDFTSLFPLSYYAYNQGTLLSFMGNGIKTVGKNQFDSSKITTGVSTLALTKTNGKVRAVYPGGQRYVGFNFYGSPLFTDTFIKGKYRLSFDVKGLDTQWSIGLRQGATFIGSQTIAPTIDYHYSFTIDTEANPNCYLSFARTGNKTTAYDVTFSNIQLELGTVETPYTQYEEQTISLPISQYFPDGMKSAGNVYDEITETKAITRIGSVDLGSLTWTKDGQDLLCFATTNLNGIVNSTGTWADTPVNALCTIYKATYGTLVYRHLVEAQMCLGTDGNGKLYIYDPSKENMTANEFKTAMSGIYLYYELKTSTETSFTTASLVTENAEIPLSNEDGTLIGKCTEELSENPGFFDAKIKLADEDGECYSNKLQLHVERSPQ